MWNCDARILINGSVSWLVTQVWIGVMMWDTFHRFVSRMTLIPPTTDVNECDQVQR